MLTAMAEDGFCRNQFETGTSNGGLYDDVPRFGSAHFRMAAHTVARTTFCYPDSVLNPADFGYGTRVSALIALAERDETDLLDDYVEALVLDPSHRGTSACRPKNSNAIPRTAVRNSSNSAWHCFGALP